MTTILAVDDNPANLLLIKKILASRGNIPDLAHNGLEALKMMREKHYDLVLVDVMMPFIDGIETVRLIREAQPEAPPYVALVTAVDLEECQSMLKDHVIDALISKGSAYSSFKTSLLNLLDKVIS